MPKFDSLGDRMKFYESLTGGISHLMPLVPGIIRLDGRAFHTFTRGMEKPFDLNLISLMTETTKFLVEETNAVVGYTQSDEITLVLYSEDHDTQIYFDGKIQKINSILAGKCANFFNSNMHKYLPNRKNDQTFDCRCFSVPNKEEAVNVLLWREQDATRNSVQMVGQANFSHKQLLNKSCKEIQEMLWQDKNINWNDFPVNCKRGTYIQRRKTSKPFSASELEKLPEKHMARQNPDLVIVRNEISEMNLPPLSRIKNKIEVMFDGENPDGMD